MGDTITVKEAATLWGITERRVTVLCKEGRIEGAYKKNRSWIQPKAFWQSTGSNEIIGEILAHAGEEIYERLNALLRGESFLTYIDTGVIYPQIRNNPSSVYSTARRCTCLRCTDAEPITSRVCLMGGAS